MKCMLMHYSEPSDEADVPPSPEKIVAIGALMAETAQAGCCWRPRGCARRTAPASPSTTAKELIAGFAILDVASREEAVEHARRFAEASGATKVDARRVAEL